MTRDGIILNKNCEIRVDINKNTIERNEIPLRKLFCTCTGTQALIYFALARYLRNFFLILIGCFALASLASVIGAIILISSNNANWFHYKLKVLSFKKKHHLMN